MEPTSHCSGVGGAYQRFPCPQIFIVSPRDLLGVVARSDHVAEPRPSSTGCPGREPPTLSPAGLSPTSPSGLVQQQGYQSSGAGGRPPPGAGTPRIHQAGPTPACL
ncbi:hypothetical protein NDU88_007484 [Pleurodeles waltl]|uniref:Uncharacterized protein n=1 Tax=Pleurodeles waltl TaxID=8319 RepID=A0AAV7LUP6_PLEWA|nr:hypothetical protein NDU88_007484 [Pleurodeles waltl]